MNQHVARLIDRVGLFLLHRQKSRQSHFAAADENLILLNAADLESLYPTPRLPDIVFEACGQYGGYEAGQYRYASEIKSGHPANDVASGWYYINRQEGPPVHVIVVHGWRMDSLDRVKNIFLTRLLNLKYHLYFPHLPYHFERTSGGRYSGEYMISAHVSRSVTSVRQSVNEIRSLIRWLKKQRGGKIVLIGVSLGGLIANLTSVTEEQIDVLVSVMYSNSLAYEVWNTPIGKYIKRDLERHQFTYEELKKCWGILEPSRWQPKVKKENILLITGLYDQYIEKVDSDVLWEAWERPKRLLYPCGHAGIVLSKKRIAEDVTQFLKERLK